MDFFCFLSIEKDGPGKEETTQAGLTTQHVQRPGARCLIGKFFHVIPICYANPANWNRAKKNGSMKTSIRGFPNIIRLISRHPWPRGHTSLASSRQVFWLPVLPPPAPSRFASKKTSGILRDSSPVTAAGPSPIRTEFPFKLGQERLNNK